MLSNFPEPEYTEQMNQQFKYVLLKQLTLFAWCLYFYLRPFCYHHQLGEKLKFLSWRWSVIPNNFLDTLEITTKYILSVHSECILYTLPGKVSNPEVMYSVRVTVKSVYGILKITNIISGVAHSIQAGVCLSRKPNSVLRSNHLVSWGLSKTPAQVLLSPKTYSPHGSVWVHFISRNIRESKFLLRKGTQVLLSNKLFFVKSWKLGKNPKRSNQKLYLQFVIYRSKIRWIYTE